MKFLFIVCLLFLPFSTVFYSSAREVIPFNEDWLYKNPQFSKKRPETRTEMSAFTDPVLFSSLLKGNWENLISPHTWNNIDMQTDKNNYYEGEAYYRKSFHVNEEWKGKRVFIRFEGVGSVADVYVKTNSTDYSFVGNHKGAYSAFSLELTKLLKYGEVNEIFVKVNNASRPDVIPINQTLFGVYGGIYRPVQLVITEKVNISVTDNASSGIYISQENVTNKSADVNVKVKLENKHTKHQNIELLTTIYEANGDIKDKQKTYIKLSPQGRQTFTQHFLIKKPHLWQGLEDPYLYKVVTQVIQENTVLDEVIQPLGLRHFELKASDGMYLNGKKVPMHGVCRHQDWWQLGSALKKENHDKDLEFIKEIGATTIRLAHYQQSDYFYSKCDSIGFMVWAEIPFVNRVSGKEADNAKQQLKELIRQSYNHPSIYVWGLHNEVYNPQAYTVELTADLNDLAKTEDPYRYTVSVNGHNNLDQGVNMNADIQGVNHYFGWYGGKVGDIEKWVESVEKDYSDYKVIFSEYGTEANVNQQRETVTDVGDCCGFDKDYNETFATKFHEIQWGVISKHPVLIASYIWNMFDFATPASSQGRVEARNMKGLITFDRKIKKDPFYWYKANWSKEPVLYITQRRVVNRGNEITHVTVYSNIGIPKLLVNGVEIKTYNKGVTDIHYIFENIKLKEGENLIEVKANHNQQEHYDKIVWNYSEKYKNIDNNTPAERLEHHIGL